MSSGQPASPITANYDPISQQVLATFGILQYAETMVAGTPNNFAATYAFENDFPIVYDFTCGGTEVGVPIATPYLGLTFNTSGTSSENLANFILTIDQYEMDFDQYELLLASQTVPGV